SGRRGVRRHGFRCGSDSRSLREASVFLDRSDESGTRVGGSETASEGEFVGEGIDGRAVQDHPALSEPGRVRRVAAAVGVSGRAESETTRLLRVLGEPRRAFRREGTARLFDTGETPNWTNARGAENSDDQRPELECGDGDRVVPVALADRVILQGVEEYVWIRPVPLPSV